MEKYKRELGRVSGMCLVCQLIHCNDKKVRSTVGIGGECWCSGYMSDRYST